MKTDSKSAVKEPSLKKWILMSGNVYSQLPKHVVISKKRYTGCPTRYRTRHFFNNFTTNEDIATKFEADLPHCVRNVKEKNVHMFKFLCNIFIGVRIIKEIPGSVASGTLCINGNIFTHATNRISNFILINTFQEIEVDVF
jgi:hypothetical protein